MKNPIERYFWQLLAMITALAGYIVYQNKREYNTMQDNFRKQQEQNLEAHRLYAKQIEDINKQLKIERDNKDSIFKILITEQTLNRIKK